MLAQIGKAITTLNQGGVIAYPTESVYGLGCDPFKDQAVRRLLQLKHRDPNKGLILVVDSLDAVKNLLQPITQDQFTKAYQTWPGPVTWVFPAKPSVSPLLTGQHKSLAIRISNHPVVEQLVAQYGKPLISTSANLEGEPPARTAKTVQAIFGNHIDYVIEGEVGDLNAPTEIRDVITGKVIRPGQARG